MGPALPKVLSASRLPQSVRRSLVLNSQPLLRESHSQTRGASVTNRIASDWVVVACVPRAGHGMKNPPSSHNKPMREMWQVACIVAVTQMKKRKTG